MNKLKQLEKEYNILCRLFNVYCRAWPMLHESFSPYVFCDANKKRFISEYLIWEEFVENAKKLDFTYYYGIDIFLREYKRAVYKCLNL